MINLTTLLYAQTPPMPPSTVAAVVNIVVTVERSAISTEIHLF